MKDKIVMDFTIAEGIDETIAEIVENYSEQIISALQNKNIDSAFDRAMGLAITIGLVRDMLKNTPLQTVKECATRYIKSAHEFKESLDSEIMH